MSPNTDTTFLFIGDIGGTNCRLSIYSTLSNNNDDNDDNNNKPLYTKEYANESYITDTTKTFENEIFIPFLKDFIDSSTISDVDIHDNIKFISCFAVAGPIQYNSVTLTNLNNIVLNGTSIEQNTTTPYIKHIHKCKLINDFVGQGYGLLDLNYNNPNDVIELIPGSKDKVVMKLQQKQQQYEYGPKVCVGAGTGLGECFLTTSSLHPEEGYECYASEGGHVDFVPRDDVQVKLLNYLKKKFNETNRVSVERVVSGKGLANIYEFLAMEFPDLISNHVHEDFGKEVALQGKVVGVNANKGDESCPLCIMAMNIMMSAYGAEVGNCALKFIPTGGLYVSGGLTPKNIKFIQGEDSPFMKAYKDKGRLSPLLDNIPLFAVLAEDLGLRGARVCALRVRILMLYMIQYVDLCYL